MASPILHGALKNDFGEAVVACDMPEPCKCPSFDSCQKRFLWPHKEVDLAIHAVVSLVLKVENTERFPHALGFLKSGSFFQSQQVESMFHSRKGGWS